MDVIFNMIDAISDSTCFVHAAFVDASNGCGQYAATVANYLRRNRFLVGSKKRREEGGEIKLNERGMEKIATFSDSIRSHLQSLLDSTTIESNLLVKAASILEIDYSQQMLVLLYTASSKTPPPAHSINELLQSGLLNKTGNEGTLSFSNMQLRDQVYKSLTSTQRTGLHLHLLELLEQDQDHVPTPLLFHHAYEAKSKKSLLWGLQAAKEQQKAFLLKDALATIETVAGLLPEKEQVYQVDELARTVEILQVMRSESRRD